MRQLGSTAGRTEEGYRALYRTHRPRVVRLCRLLLSDRHEAEDVAQEVFVALLKEWEGPERPMMWGAWLTRVAVNACHRRRRSKWWRWRGGTGEEFLEADFPSPRATPDQDAVDAETRRRILGVYKFLSQRQREIFVLRHVEGWSSQDVALALGLSDGTVKRHLFRATQAFRKALGEAS
ncbi:MAG: sigma-70 family RNA polymerase sigma factor [Candidatus Binatia bacterium]